MAEALITPNYARTPGEEPFIGDLSPGEEFYNFSDGRLWVGDDDRTPIEVGGNCKNKPLGPASFCSYVAVDLTDPANLPISNTNPQSIPNGFYREIRFLLQFKQNPLTNISAYFDYPVDWGDPAAWNSFGLPSVPSATNPIDRFKRQGRKILLELSSFGPSVSWTGRLLWVNR